MRARLAKSSIVALALASLSVGCASINGPRGGRIFLPPDNDQAKQQFQRLKQLEGTWAWAPELAPDLTGVVVTYEVTAAGSAVLETMFPGDQFEMVTLYHLDGEQLVLTHYSSAGNQPTMRARAGKPDAPEGPIHFEYLGATNLSSVNTGHMHRMSFLEIDGDELLTSWTFHEDQKSAGDRVFKLRRLDETTDAAAAEVPTTSDILPAALRDELEADLEALEAELAAEAAAEELPPEVPMEDLPEPDEPVLEEPVVDEAVEGLPADAPAAEPSVAEEALEEEALEEEVLEEEVLEEEVPEEEVPEPDAPETEDPDPGTPPGTDG